VTISGNQTKYPWATAEIPPANEATAGNYGPSETDSTSAAKPPHNIASKFREITTKAIDVYYSRDECFEIDEIKIST